MRLALAITVSCAVSAGAQPLVVSTSAHERLAGHVGVGFLGTGQVFGAQENVPFGPWEPFAWRRTTVPLLGVRWWVGKSRVGLELGAGVMSQGEGGPSVELLTHAAVPFSVVSTKHAILFVAPEVRFGFSYLSDEVTATTWAFHLRGGIELFFGFIGLENLSLELSLRAGLIYEEHVRATFGPLLGRRDSVQTFTRFSSSVVANPFEVLSSSLALRYYF